MTLSTRFLSAILAVAALSLPVTAWAVPPKSAVPTGEGLTLTPNPSDFAAAALRIVVATDQGQAPQIWDTASPVMKTIVGRDQFSQVALQRHAATGGLRNFTWRSIIRVQMAQAQGQLPAGNYLSVAIVGVNKDGKIVVETVSFILDGDQKWRLIGLTQA